MKPDELAEVMDRVEQLTRGPRYDHRQLGMMLAPFLVPLLSCARRCLAIDAGGFDHDMFTDLLRRGDDGKSELGPQYIRKLGAIVDAAAESQQLRSERDALAKRVESMDGQAVKMILRLRDTIGRAQDAEAESARLREELDAAQRREIAAHNSAGELARRCEDAERRVRSTATNRELAAIHELDAAKTANARLREENERLARLVDLVTAGRTEAIARLTAAQDRVRELEEAIGRPPTHDEQDCTGEVDIVCDGCGDEIDPDEHDWATCCLGLRQHRDRLLNARIDLEMSKEALPSPSQGVGTTGGERE
jgi:hypothetical protein